jgi:hypothetical protein
MEVHPPSFISKILLVGTARKVEKNFFYFGAQRRRLVHSGEARMANDEHVTARLPGTHGVTRTPTSEGRFGD